MNGNKVNSVPILSKKSAKHQPHLNLDSKLDNLRNVLQLNFNQSGSLLKKER